MGILSGVSTIYRWELAIVIAVNAAMFLLLIHTIHKVGKQSKYTWLVHMLYLLIFANVMILAANLGYVL